MFPTQGSNPGLLHWQADSLPSEPPETPSISITDLTASPCSQQNETHRSQHGIQGLHDVVWTDHSSSFLTSTLLNPLFQQCKTTHHSEHVCTFLPLHRCLCCSYNYYSPSLVFHSEKPSSKPQLKCHIYKKLFLTSNIPKQLVFLFSVIPFLQHSDHRIVMYPHLLHFAMIQGNTGIYMYYSLLSSQDPVV